jgi:hypothetical protein
MVVIHIKNTDEHQFLFETSCDESIDALIRKIVHVWNTRLRIARLCRGVQQLGLHGPAKPPAERGVDDVLSQAAPGSVQKGAFYNADPLGNRSGNACNPKLLEVMEKTCNDALQCISKQQAARRVALTAEMLQEKIDNIRGAVTIAYPMGLPEYDDVKQEINGTAEIVGQDTKLVFDPDTATLWFAGKEFFRDQIVKDRIRHEKSKIVAKLGKKGGGAPAREAAVSEAERKAMMAHYFKKQKEMKEITEDDDDSFANSSWANPKGLKNSLHGRGGGGVRFRAGGGLM